MKRGLEVQTYQKTSEPLWAQTPSLGPWSDTQILYKCQDKERYQDPTQDCSAFCQVDDQGQVLSVSEPPLKW